MKRSNSNWKVLSVVCFLALQIPFLMAASSSLPGEPMDGAEMATFRAGAWGRGCYDDVLCEAGVNADCGDAVETAGEWHCNVSICKTCTGAKNVICKYCWNPWCGTCTDTANQPCCAPTECKVVLMGGGRDCHCEKLGTVLNTRTKCP